MVFLVIIATAVSEVTRTELTIGVHMATTGTLEIQVIRFQDSCPLYRDKVVTAEPDGNGEFNFFVAGQLVGYSLNGSYRMGARPLSAPATEPTLAEPARP